MQKKSLRGATLMEMMIVLAISSLIIASVGALIRAGVDYYFYSTTQLEVQRNSLLSLSIITQELTASSYESVRTENGGANPGVIFAVSQDPSGKPQRAASGNLEWTHFVAYYVDTVLGEQKLMRKKLPITPTVNPPDPSALGHSIATIRADGSLEERLMARNISNVTTEELTDALKITMTAEIQKGRNWLEMDVETTIVPRN